MQAASKGGGETSEKKPLSGGALRRSQLQEESNALLKKKEEFDETLYGATSAGKSISIQDVNPEKIVGFVLNCLENSLAYDEDRLKHALGFLRLQPNLSSLVKIAKALVLKVNSGYGDSPVEELKKIIKYLPHLLATKPLRLLFNEKKWRSVFEEIYNLKKPSIPTMVLEIKTDSDLIYYSRFSNILGFSGDLKILLKLNETGLLECTMNEANSTELKVSKIEEEGMLSLFMKTLPTSITNITFVVTDDISSNILKELCQSSIRFLEEREKASPTVLFTTSSKKDSMSSLELQVTVTSSLTYAGFQKSKHFSFATEI